MEKFKSFFLKINFMNENEYEKTKDSCDFQIKNDNVIKVTLSFNNLIEPKLYFSLLNRKNNFGSDIEIIFDSSNLVLDKEDITKYLIYYIEHLSINNVHFKNCILRNSTKIEDNSLILFYLNDIEKDGIEKYTSGLNLFLQQAGILFNEIRLELDEKVKEIELYKNSKLENVKSTLINTKKTNYESKKEIVFKNKFKPVYGEVEKIANLIPEQGESTIIGKVFKRDKLVVKGDKTIYKFYITDYTDSILVKCFTSKYNGQTEEDLELIKEGTWIKTRVSIQVDMYEKNDLTCLSKNLEIIDEPKDFEIKDNSENKRIEFINHTVMSAFEGVTRSKDYISFLKRIGHKTLVITDKFNCQIYPEISSIAKKSGIDLIYGVQTNLLNSPIDIVKNAINKNIENKFVVFDIETTGLYPYVHEIIEFGAIKYENGEIVERKQFFMKPSKPIPNKISEITRITNDTVKDGLSEIEGLKEILEFCKDYPLIAHNGIAFDINFINVKLEKNNLPVLNNILIDTMQLSRAMNETLSSHSLGNICKKLKIEYNNLIAHRADFDAEVLLSVWKWMLIDLKNKGIKTYQDINNYFQNDLLKKRNRGFLITLYAKKQNSIKPLYKLISKSLTTNYYDKPLLFIDDILEYKEDILLSNSPSEGDIIFSALSETNEQLANRMKKYDFITISPPSSLDHEINRQNISLDEVKLCIKRIIEIANNLDKKVIASSDVYYLRPENEKAFDVYVHTKSIGGKPHRVYSYQESNDVLPKYFYRTTNEMLKEFNFLDSKIVNEIVIQNTNELLNQFELNVNVLKLDKLYTPTIENAKENLEKLTYQRMIEKYGQNPDPIILSRIDRELKSIIQNGYSIIYWFSHLLVKKSNDDGYYVGSRGSVGSSLVATMVGITEVNPLPPYYLCDKCKNFYFVKNVNSGFDLPDIECEKCGDKMKGDGHNIPFETFMGFEGDKVPDIDLNFSAEYQAKAHNFIMNTFGKSHTLKAGTIGTVAEKTAFGYVKNYFESKGIHKVKNAEILRLSTECQDVKRTTGQHPGGIIVVPKELEAEDFTPINYPADDIEFEWNTTHYAFEYLHDSLLKFDILGHDTPTFLKMLENITNINSSKIPNHDEKVMQMFYDIEGINIKSENLFNNKVGTNGLPEFGTSFVKEMLTITLPKKFSDLIRISGLSHGTDVWLGNAKDLIENNNINISEVISCRDDIMVYLIEKGLDNKDAFNIMENVRKGKGLTEDYIEKMKNNNVPDWYINSCNKIKYLFPKAHATAYVSMAWKIAWYKYYYPLAFYSTFFSIKTTVFDLPTIIQGREKIVNTLNLIKNALSKPETKYQVKNKELDLIPIYEMCIELIERGFYIKNVDINLSQVKEFLIVDNCYLIPPFSVIDGLGESVAQSIVDARNEKKFSSREDLLNRTKISKTHLKYMIDNNILDDLANDDQLSLFG